MRLHHRSKKTRRGSALLEFAIIIPMMLLLLVGAIDVGRGYSTAGILVNAAREGARYGATNPKDTTTIQDHAIEEAWYSGVKLYRSGESSVEVFKTNPGERNEAFAASDEPKAGDPIRVRATYRYRPLLGPLLGSLNRIRIVRECTMPILENQQASYGDPLDVEDIEGDPDFEDDPDDAPDELPDCEECDPDDPNDCPSGCIAG